MIVVDSSVWINQLRRVESESVRKVGALGRRNRLLVGDLVLLEVLQGARDDAHAARLRLQMQAYEQAAMFDDEIAVETATNFRRLRSNGVTIRKTIDLIIGTFCIVHGHSLLHDDRDFAPMAVHLGLRIA